MVPHITLEHSKPRYISQLKSSFPLEYYLLAWSVLARINKVVDPLVTPATFYQFKQP
jgi:hypothetical protein